MRAWKPKAEWVVSMEDAGEGNGDSALTVETIANHIYFYSYVNQDRCLDLIKQIRKLDETLRNERITRNIPDDHPKTPIWLHIFSEGGEAFSGLAVSDFIKQVETPVYSIVEGRCASAATFISMVCARRYIQPSSYMLIHQYSTGVFGTHEELEDERVLGRMLIEQMADFYANRSKLDIDEVRELMKRNLWLNAEQSIEKGLADDIYTG